MSACERTHLTDTKENSGRSPGCQLTTTAKRNRLRLTPPEKARQNLS